MPVEIVEKELSYKIVQAAYEVFNGLGPGFLEKIYQEAMILVKGGYTPDVILVERGKPVRLNFVRTESASCSEMVMFPDFNKSAYLPEGETVALELMPDSVGEFEFQCQMGMLRGKLVVE